MSIFSKLLLYFTLFVYFHYYTLANGISYFDKSGKPTKEENTYYTRKLISGYTYQNNYINRNLCFEVKIIKLDKIRDKKYNYNFSMGKLWYSLYVKSTDNS